MLLTLDLQRFADGGGEDLDFDAMLTEFESEWDETEDAEPETDTQSEDVTDANEDETQQTDDEAQDETQPDPNDSDETKRNRAFADLRRQAEENRRYADFIARLAEQGGTTPEEIMQRYEEMQLAQQAQTLKVPVEMLKRQSATEAELAGLKDQLAVERLNYQVENVKAKYNSTDQDVISTFQYMYESGIDPKTTPDFEKFYRAAHLDSIIQKEVEAARQKDLEDKKARQDAAAVPNGNSATQSTGDLSDEDVDALLAKMGIRI